MNLPEIFDIAIGLFFIYLILSLLASEIQELIATILQWRAKHLKRSIEALLAGGSESPEQELSRVRILANEIYNDPLINTLNQEARGPMASWFRDITKFWGALGFKIYCMMTRKNEQKEKIFDDRNSGPSYLHAETFATTLFKTLAIPKLLQQASGVSLEKFIQERLKIIQSLYQDLAEPNLSENEKNILNQDLADLEQEFFSAVKNLKDYQITLNASLNKMEEALNSYIENVEARLPGSEFTRRIKSLTRKTFSPTNKTILLKSLQRSLTEVLADYQDIKKAIDDPNSASYQKILEIYGDVENLIEQRVLKTLPDSLIASLTVLAKRMQIKIEATENELKHFQTEIETWFDRSMERATGVYRRNAKGVAILIGLMVATVTNSDTIHIVGRLSKDAELRRAIAQNSGQLVSGCPTPKSVEDTVALNCIRQRIEPALKPVSLPIGWSEINRGQQAKQSETWQIFGWNFGLLQRILGWLISGLAIAMGAPFWFDLLGKFINVRNAGPKPASSTQDKSPSS